MIIDVEIRVEKADHWVEQSKSRLVIESVGADPYNWLKSTSGPNGRSQTWRVKATDEQATMLRLIAVSTSTKYYEETLAKIEVLNAEVQERLDLIKALEKEVI